MEQGRFELWLKRILETEAEEISCSECFSLTSSCADLELAGGEAEARLPSFILHLKQCQACREEYETLRDLLILDKEGSQPSIDELITSIE